MRWYLARLLAVLVVQLTIVGAAPSAAQRANTYSNTARGGVDVKQVAGRKVGNVTTRGNIILLELDADALTPHNLFDLDRRTIRFTPAGTGYRAENLPLQWDTARGAALQGQGNLVHLTKFKFPFSGRSWDSLQVQTIGLITFGGGYNDLGLGRFVHLQRVGPDIANTIPAIAAFLKQRMNGTRYVNELDDRLVVTWDTSEPTSGQQDVTFTRTPHHYQAVLHRDGRIDISYREITARDAVVGVYTVPANGTPQAVDLSAVKPTDAPRPVIFEAFHHYGLPGSSNLACTVIQALGDQYDFMVWYSDFRVDDQEAGTRSVGDIGQRVQGLGPRMDIGLRSQDYCSQGRLQVTWYQPVWIGAVQAQERHPDGRFPGYNMAVAQIGHELAHRWSTRTRAIVNGDTIELRGPHDPWGMSGATHWPGSVSTPVPFPYSRPVEASIMGGTNWKDNGDGTFTQLANGTMNPASGFSYLELYLMGMLPASRVPDFFVLRNQRNVGRTPEGQNIVAAEKLTVTINDVIAHNGPRVPSYENAPKAHTTAMVAVTLKGRQPGAAMLAQLEGIRTAWIDYWSKVTGGVGTMTTPTSRSP